MAFTRLLPKVNAKDSKRWEQLKKIFNHTSGDFDDVHNKNEMIQLYVKYIGIPIEDRQLDQPQIFNMNVRKMFGRNIGAVYAMYMTFDDYYTAAQKMPNTNRLWYALMNKRDSYGYLMTKIFQWKRSK